MNDTTLHLDQPVYATGTPLEAARAVVILIHGRGATAPSILELASAIPADGVAYLAPQADGNVWYPYSFLAPMQQNEPGLSSGLQAIDNLVNQVQAAGIATDNIILGGFSQGACLASEYAARNAQRYGGLMAFSGGLIGPPGTPRDYVGFVRRYACVHRLQRRRSSHPAGASQRNGRHAGRDGGRGRQANLPRYAPHDH